MIFEFAQPTHAGIYMYISHQRQKRLYTAVFQTIQ